LARQGFAVTVLEKNPRPGGRVGTLENAGYRFDTGPTLFLMPEVFAQTYLSLGERMEDHLDLIRLDPTYRIHFQDGNTMDLSADLNQMQAQLEAIEPGSFPAYLRFIAEGARHYHVSLEKFVGRNFYSLLDYFSLKNLPLLFQLKALTRHAENTGRYFRDPRLLAAFSFQNMYLGLSPFDAPATYSLLQYTELADGVWFPMGGLYRVIESLEAIAKNLGVKFHYGTGVRSIDVDGNRTTGVTLATGERLPADLIIANADLPYVYKELLPPSQETEKLFRKKFTSSALMYFWGIKGKRPPELLHHNVFLADQEYQSSFERIFTQHTLPANPSFYVCAPTRTDPDFAPADGDSLMALVPVGHLDDQKPQDWEGLQRQARQVVIGQLESLGLPDFEGRIAYEKSWGPQFYQDELNLVKGAAFGLSHNFMQVGYLRPHNRHARYGNLYFTGASTHPGTGLPIVLLSAQLAVERILKEQPQPAKQAVVLKKLPEGV
jgi:phytoene desaturase